MKRKDNITALVNCLKAVCRNLEALTEFMESVKDSETDINTFNTSANVKSKERKEETKEISPAHPFRKKRKKRKKFVWTFAFANRTKGRLR